MPRLANLFRFRGERAGSSVPDFDASTIFKAYRLPQVAWDYPKAYRLIPDIRFCVGLIADGVVAAPLRFYTPARDGEKLWIDPVKGNVAHLFETANTIDTGRELIGGIAAARALFGTAYLFKDWTPLGLQLWLLSPLSVTVNKGPRRTIESYTVKDGGQDRVVPAELIVQFNSFDPQHGVEAASALEALVQQYEASYDASQMVRLFMRNGGIPPGFFTTSAGLELGMLRRIGRQIDRMISRVREKWASIVLPKDLVYARAALTYQEMQLVDLDDMATRKMLRVFRIPPSYAGLVNDATGMNSDTARSARRQFHELVREPECSAIAAVMNERLFAASDFVTRYGRDIRCEFDFSGLPSVQEDKLDEAVKLVTLTGRPIMTADEAREQIGLEALGGSAGELVMPLAMMTDEDRDDMAVVGTGEDTDASPEEKGAADPKRSLTRLLEAHRDRRAHLRARNQTALVRHERSMKRAWLRVFKRQRIRTAARLREQFDGRSIAGRSEVADSAWLRAISLDDLLRDDAMDERIIRRIVKAIVEEQGEAAIAELALGLAFDINAQTVRVWISENAARAIRETSETTRARLRTSIGEGVEANEGLNELIARVDAVFDGRRGNAATIARTESAGAYNYSTIEAWDQSGEVESKEWLSAHDDAVRESHVEADGQVVPLGDTFTVEGEQCDFPGDPGLSPEQRINCRCTTLPVLRQRVLLPGPIAKRVNGNGKPSRPLSEWLAKEEV